jgi:hypothetical protein
LQFHVMLLILNIKLLARLVLYLGNERKAIGSKHHGY